jgi:D-alanyl-D-alanine carboxypeptidase
LVDTFADERGGAAVRVVSDGAVIELGVGERNDLGEPMTASTPSRVGSLSKPFVATMVLQLVDERQVDLDAPLGDYLPDTPAGAEVSIRDLLRHHSGLPDYTARSDFFEDSMADRDRRFQPAELLAYIEPVAPAPAGQRFAYSNTNYVLLGQLIEHLDGVDLNTALRTRIGEPLDLDVTRFDTGELGSVEGLASAWSPGVVYGKPGDPYASIASGAWAAGALVSTPGELATFLAALFDGELVSATALSEMTTVGPDGYGLGLGSGEFEPGHPDYGHNGEIFGYLSFMAIQPDSGDVIVVLVNNDQIDVDQLLFDILSIAW